MSNRRNLSTAALLLGVLTSLTVLFTDCARVSPSDDFGFEIEHGRSSTSELGMTEAQVEAIFKGRMGLAYDPKLPRALYSLCRHYRFDPAFILSVIQVESAFHANALSPAGAVGLMQLMPGTAAVILKDSRLPMERKTLDRLHSIGCATRSWIDALQDPFVNMTLGVAYLAYLRDKYVDLHPFYLIAAYNVGPAKMDELISRKSFKPVKTGKYFEAIRQGISAFRGYKGPV